VTTVRLSALILSLVVLLGPRSVAQAPDRDATGARIGAKKASDALMADLVGNRMADAMEKIAPKAKLGSEGFRKTQTQMIDQCGRPLDSKIQNNGKAFLGEDVLPEGTKTNWTFQYHCKTTRQPAEYWVTVEMVEGGHYKLAFTCNPDHQGMAAQPQ
jgi:hypothetical protein